MPRRHLDQVVVVDVEATCWEGEPPLGQESAAPPSPSPSPSPTPPTSHPSAFALTCQ